MKRILVPLIIASLFMISCTPKLVETKAPKITAQGTELDSRTYRGNAVRTRYFCDDYDNCKQCEATGPLTVVFSEDGTVGIDQETDCMGLSENGCYTKGNKCQYTITGTYSIADGRITLEKCNGPAISTEGQSYFDDNKIEGSVLCKFADKKIIQIEWKDLPRAI